MKPIAPPHVAGADRSAELVRLINLLAPPAGDGSRRVSEIVVCAQAVPRLLPLLRDDALLLVPATGTTCSWPPASPRVNGVRLAGLVLTAGVRPDPAVMRLTAAAATTGLAILVVDTLTYPTAVRLHDLVPEMATDDLDRARDVARTVADALDPAWAQALPEPGRRRRLTPAAFRHHIVESARRSGSRIVLPERAEPRTVTAAITCAERGIAATVLLAAPAEIGALARSLPASIDVIDPTSITARYVDQLVALRAHKGMTRSTAQERLGDPITEGAMMLEAGEVDGLVAGAMHTTAATVRPALELIRVAPGVRLVSLVMFTCLPDEVVVYGDCAINPDPGAADLADLPDIALQSAAALGIPPRVTLISFSTARRAPASTSTRWPRRRVSPGNSGRTSRSTGRCSTTPPRWPRSR